MIQIQQAVFGYNEALFSAENLVLVEGEMYALVGKNGAGKSTFLNTLKTMIPLIKGNIAIHQQQLQRFSRRELAKIIAFVESKVESIEFLSVRDYIALGRSPYTNVFGKLNAEDDAIVERVLQLLGLEQFADRFIDRLSDGEKQLAAIARALVQNTPIILLDEPTAFLDYGNRKKLIETLSFLAKNENKCIIFSCHDIDLCLEESLSILLIASEKKELLLMKQPTRKELLELAFSA
jgi:iron complex transport system ATP-binding protein